MSYVTKRIRLLVPANKAKPAPAIGQALGSIGINMMKFCKEFNAMTVKYKDDLPMRVRLSSFNDGSYKFSVHPPQSTWFIKKCAGVELGSSYPGPLNDQWVGEIHSKQVFEIALVKFNDKEHEELSDVPVVGIYKSLLATCRSMGIKVNYEREEETAKRLKEEARARARAEDERRRAAKREKQLLAARTPTY